MSWSFNIYHSKRNVVVIRGLLNEQLKCAGDALKEFLVFPRALYRD